MRKFFLSKKSVSTGSCDRNAAVKRILAIANQKGGVGKTTTTVNLAASIANAGHRVLVVDMDPQANATSGLGLSQGHAGRGNLRRAGADGQHEAPRPLRELTAADRGPEPVAASRRRAIWRAPRSSWSDVKRREFRLRDALSPIADQYDYIVIDCPPSLGPPDAERAGRGDGGGHPDAVRVLRARGAVAPRRDHRAGEARRSIPSSRSTASCSRWSTRA